MKLFNKKTESDNKSKKLRNKSAWKQGGYAIAITAVIVAVAVGVNVLFAILANRVNLNIDISLSGDNTLSQENVEYIKGLEDKIDITVCFAKEDFVTGTESVAQNYYSASDTTGSNGKYAYYEQSLNLLEQYDVYSKNITLKFVDPYETAFSEITQKYSTVTMGDIIVECAKNIGGETTVRSQILSFDDIYYLEEDDTYAQYFGTSSYMVAGNNLETALTSAIYKATSNETQKALVLQHHCKEDNITEYISLLNQNNFDVEIFEETVINEIDAEVDMLIIAEPTEDFAPEELNVIDEWLYNGGLRGKGIMYFASPSSPNMPNLYAYLEEWGVAFDTGVLYETSAGNRVFGDPTANVFVPTEIVNENETDEEVTKQFDKLLNGREVYSSINVPILQVFKEEGSRLTTPLAETPDDTVVIKPLNASSDWKPDGSNEQNKHIGILLASESDYVDNVLCTSYVAVFSSVDFVNPYWFSTLKTNEDAILNTPKLVSGAEDDGLSFSMRMMEEESFVVDGNAINIMTVLFQWLAPVTIIVAGVVIFVRRSRR